MNPLLRASTFFERLKYRLDEIDDCEMDLVIADRDSPAWAKLTRNLFALMDTRDSLRYRLAGVGVEPKDFAMGKVEFLLAGLVSVLAVLAVVVVTAGVEL